MKFTTSLKTALLLVPAVALASCASVDNVKQAATSAASGEATYTLTGTEALSRQLTDATLWMQKSAEYKAISEQTFYAATQAFSKAKAPKGKLKAVVVDLDETMIDNSPFEASLIKEGASYSSKVWNKWELEGNPKALPGAKEFANYVNSHGGKMYYVSNRKQDNVEATIKLLNNLGFTGATKETVLLKDKTSDKNPRFEQVNKENPVVVYVGDNLGDFPNAYANKTVESRKAFVDANKDKFGTMYFVLPNAMYGDWMSSLAPNWYGKKAGEQYQWKLDNVEDWKDYPYSKK